MDSRMRLRYGIPLVALAATLALSGCANNTTATAPSGKVDTGTKDAALAALLPAAIASSGTVQVGVDATYAPVRRSGGTSTSSTRSRPGSE
jgi:polar amino acid transport system substrate-binding protein